MIVCSVMVSGQEYDGYYTNPILPSGADPWVVNMKDGIIIAAGCRVASEFPVLVICIR